MGILTAKIIFANGKTTNSTIARQINCSSAGIAAGFIEPIGDCCENQTSWREVKELSLSTNPNARYGVWVTDESGEEYLIDVQGGVEVAATAVTLPILQAKLDKALLGCACVDCTDVSPVTTIAGQYNGVYPNVSTLTTYTVARDGNFMSSVSNVTRDYAPYADSDIIVKSVAGTVVTYEFKAAKKPILVKTGDVIAP